VLIHKKSPSLTVNLVQIQFAQTQVYG